MSIFDVAIGGELSLAEMDMGADDSVVILQIADSPERRKFILVKRVSESGGDGSFWRRIE